MGSAKRPRPLPLPTPSEAAFERLLQNFEALEAAPRDAPVAGTAVAQETPAPPKRARRERTGGDPGLNDAVRGDIPPGNPAGDDPAGDDPARDNAARDDGARDDAARLAALFAHKDAYLERDRFATIGKADQFFTKIAGVSFEKRQDVVAGLIAGQPLELVRDPANPHDANAIEVRFGHLHVGFLSRGIARRLAPNIDGGERYTATVGSVTGGTNGKNVGVNILVRRQRLVPSRRSAVAGATGGGVSGDSEALRRALIGESALRESQRAVLERVARGANTLAVLGTGRGKSVCFQLPAAEGALRERAKTLVFYPLRALANDQFDALVRRLGPFGLRIFRANGAIDGDERAELEAALADGAWDVILSTPEFATYHREPFLRECNRPALVVVDEAHHLFESRHRPAYGSLGALIEELGATRVLALTATANGEAFKEIRRALQIEAWVIDPTVRDNLHVIDVRNLKDRLRYLADELQGDGKAIVYCNSRAEVTKLADRLRATLGPDVAFYHAGIPSLERAAVEDLFRRGAARVVVATSAFGEGIDLPNVRDVVLYHLNFDFTQFNQMAGRAGRDGADARIHLLYGDADRRINDFIIAKNAPSLDVLREIYRGLRGMASARTVRMNYEDIARTLALEMAPTGETIGAAVRIFEEGGLVEAGNDDDGHFVRLRDLPSRVDLTATTRYAEGQAEREGFARFCELALRADAATLEQIINRPIYPDGVPLVV